MYQSMKIETLSGMIPFFDFSQVEKVSVDAVKQKFVSMRVDHMKNAVIFCKKVWFCSFWCGFNGAVNIVFYCLFEVNLNNFTDKISGMLCYPQNT